jgi:hypothetical protein
MIDTNYITRRAKYILAGGDKRKWDGRNGIEEQIRYKKMCGLTKQIGDIRSVEAHSVTAKNGFFQEQQIENYKAWISNVIEPDVMPSTIAHYRALNVELEKISIELESCVELFLDYVEHATDKAQIVERWQAVIIDNYCQKEDYLYGQMAQMFSMIHLQIHGCLPKMYKSRKGVTYGLTDGDMRMILADWIRFYYLESGKPDIQADVANWSHLNNVSDLKPEHYVQYFLGNTMRGMLYNILQTQTGGNVNLLPQDILQKLIDRELKSCIPKKTA